MVRSTRIARMKVPVLALLLLLLLPVVESGHHHATAESSAPCAVCIAVSHAPAVFSAPVAVLALTLALAPTPTPTFEAPAQRVHSPKAGRAPPSSLSTLSIS